MSEPFIPWFAPETGAADRSLVAEVLKSNYLNDGPVTRRFEAAIAERLGVRHCIGVTSGTIAITTALMAAGIGPGDEVIVPDLTFIATANAVRLAGADVKLVDVDPVRFGIDPDRVREAITSRTRAVVPVDVNGRTPDYAALAELCRSHGLAMICDAAESLGSFYRDRPLGSFGDAACLSFSANKRVTTGQGGIIATNDDKLRDRCIQLKDQGRQVQGTGGDDVHPVVGYNFKLTNLQAAVGLAQLQRLDERVAHARWRDRRYREELAGLSKIVFPPPADDTEVPLWTDALFAERDSVRRALDAAGIGCRAFWFPLHTQIPYRQANTAFPNSEDVSARGLWLPSSFSLTESELNRTCHAIRTALRAA